MNKDKQRLTVSNCRRPIQSIILSMITLSMFMLSSSSAALSFEEASPQYKFNFPTDHANHPSYKQEWWYFTGHLFTEQGHRYGYEVTFFRQNVNPARGAVKEPDESLHMVHFAITDGQKKKFFSRQKYDSGSTGLTAADKGHLFVKHDDWTLKEVGGRFLLNLDNPNYSVDLVLTPQKPPIIHGKDGQVQKMACKGCGSHYYSYTNLKTEGTLKLTQGAPLPVRGLTWMDHEYMSDPTLTNELAWKWFGMQIDDGTELMLYQFPGENGLPSKYSTGSLVNRDGTTEHLLADDFVCAPLNTWTSDTSGRTYITRWIIIIPRKKMAIFVRPQINDQELNSTGVTYLEADASAVVVYWGREKQKNKITSLPASFAEKILATLESVSGFTSEFLVAPAYAQSLSQFALSNTHNLGVFKASGVNVNQLLSAVGPELTKYWNQPSGNSTVAQTVKSAMQQIATSPTSTHYALAYEEQRVTNDLLPPATMAKVPAMPMSSTPPSNSWPWMKAPFAAMTPAIGPGRIAWSIADGGCLCGRVELSSGLLSSKTFGPGGSSGTIKIENGKVTLSSIGAPPKHGTLLDARLLQTAPGAMYNNRIIADVYFPSDSKPKLSAVSGAPKSNLSDLQIVLKANEKNKSYPFIYDSLPSQSIYRVEVPVTNKSAAASHGKPAIGEAGPARIYKAPPVTVANDNHPIASNTSSSEIVSPLWPVLKKLLVDRSDIKASRFNAYEKISELLQEFQVADPNPRTISLVAYSNDDSTTPNSQLREQDVWLQEFVDWWKDMGRWNDNNPRIASMLGTALVPPAILSSERKRWSSRTDEVKRLIVEIDNISQNSGDSNLPRDFSDSGIILGSPTADLSTVRILTGNNHYVNVDTMKVSPTRAPTYFLGSKIAVSGTEILKGRVEALQTNISVLQSASPNPSVLIPVQSAVSDGKISFNLKGDGLHTDRVLLFMVNDSGSPLHIVIPKGQYFLPNNDQFDIMMSAEDRSVDLLPGVGRWIKIPSLSVSSPEHKAPPAHGVCYEPNFHPDRLSKLFPKILDLTQDLENAKAFDKIATLEDRPLRIAQVAIWKEFAHTNPASGDIDLAGTEKSKDNERILAAADLVTRLSQQLMKAEPSIRSKNLTKNNQTSISICSDKH